MARLRDRPSLRPRYLLGLRRASERSLYQIVKNPALSRKQGAFSVIDANGAILKRGHELARVLGLFDKKLKLVGA